MAMQPSEMLYLEPDDEITAVVHRLRASTAPRVVLIAAGRTKATSSAIALRLLAQVAADEGRRIALVADPGARALAAEAGIEAFPSVAEAEAEDASPPPAPPPRRASIRVIRDAPEPMRTPPGARATSGRGESAGPGDETRAAPVVSPDREPVGRRSNRARNTGPPARRRTLLLALVSVLLVSGAALAAVLPAATVVITPATQDVGPRDYTVSPPVLGPETDTFQASKQGTASGTRVEEIAATGTVTFYAWGAAVRVPAGTVVSAAGKTFFATDSDVVVPRGTVNGSGQIVAGEGVAPVTARDGGKGGNVGAGAIDTVEDRAVATALRGIFQLNGPIVTNSDPTSGGDEVQHPVIEQADVNATVTAIQADIAGQVSAKLAADESRIYAPGAPVQVVVDVPGDLVGTEDLPTFELSASYDFSRTYVTRAAIEAAAAAAMQADAGAVPSGMTLVPDSISVSIGSDRLSGTAIAVETTVSARAAVTVDAAAARQQVMGKTPSQARDALQGIGSVEIRLWPGWVDRIPRLDWRVNVEVAGE